MKRLWYLGVFVLAASPAAAQDMPLSQVLIDGEGWRPVARGFKVIGGMASDKQGNVYVSDLRDGSVRRIGTDGRVSIFAKTGTNQGLSDLAVGPAGRLYGCQPKTGRLVMLDAKGKVSTVAAGIVARDLVVTSSGAIYCTTLAGQVVYLVRSGEKTRVHKQPAKSACLSGLVLWPDQGTLVLGDLESNSLLAYRIDSDGALTHGEKYYPLRPSAANNTDSRVLTDPISSRLFLSASAARKTDSRGLTVDTAGRLYAATSAGVQIFDPTGRLCGVLSKPANAPHRGIAFGGKNHDMLYLGCGDTVYSRKTRAKGVVMGEKKTGKKSGR